MFKQRRSICWKLLNLQKHRLMIIDTKYQIPYTNSCIRAFGKRFGLPVKKAYIYLREYKGIAFLIEFYDVEHLLSIEDTVDDLIICCKNNGGYLS